MILGISASGRRDGVTADTVQAILKATDCEYDYVSLAGKRINGCIGCTLCAPDNVCKVKDDWNEIGEKMLRAEAIVFGAPDYFGMINALGHACWERTFAFRHLENFRLAGKLGVIVSVDYQGADPVKTYISAMMVKNMMAVVDTVHARGYSQCYTCGFGHNCGVGKVVRTHGFLEKIDAALLPPRFCQQEDAINQAYRAGKTLGSILKRRDK